MLPERFQDKSEQLERALARSEDACTAAIREAFDARERATELQLMVDNLEAKVPANTSAEAAVIGKNDHDRIAELEEALKVALVERDGALRTLCEIKSCFA